MHNAYCEDCEWIATADETSRQELNRAMIDHFVETGHTLVADSATAYDTASDELERSTGDSGERTLRLE